MYCVYKYPLQFLEQTDRFKRCLFMEESIGHYLISVTPGICICLLILHLSKCFAFACLAPTWSWNNRQLLVYIASAGTLRFTFYCTGKGRPIKAGIWCVQRQVWYAHNKIVWLAMQLADKAAFLLLLDMQGRAQNRRREGPVLLLHNINGSWPLLSLW